MNSEPGTLAGLIADLAELHWYDDDHGHCAYCLDHCVEQSWPCPTMQIVRKHKRAQWRVYAFGWVENRRWSAHLDDLVGLQTSPIFESKAEVDAWIDEQVNGS